MGNRYTAPTPCPCGRGPRSAPGRPCRFCDNERRAEYRGEHPQEIGEYQSEHRFRFAAMEARFKKRRAQDDFDFVGSIHEIEYPIFIFVLNGRRRTEQFALREELKK